jgi:hypothetical protein
MYIISYPLFLNVIIQNLDQLLSITGAVGWIVFASSVGWTLIAVPRTISNGESSILSNIVKQSTQDKT